MTNEEYRASRIRASHQRWEWSEVAARDLERWQDGARRAIRRAIGLRTSARASVRPRWSETVQLDGYRRTPVWFGAANGARVFAYVLVPDGLGTPRPAVVCLPGHGRGVDSIVGIASDGAQREMGRPDEYQADFALQCVERGWTAIAVEQYGFGRRRDAQAVAEGPDSSSCGRDSAIATMLGESMTGWRVRDAMRAVDLALTLPSVDPATVAMMGISGGGLTTLWTAALDTRVCAAVVSGYMNTFAGSVLAMDHCVDNFVSGMLRIMEMPDMAGLVAPRVLFAESGDEDPIFPLSTFRTAVARAQSIYAAIGRPDHFGHQVLRGEHQFGGGAAFEFLSARLRSR